MIRSISTVGLVAVLAMACSHSLPASRVASAETAVQSAREAGADRAPAANKQLTLAEDELAQAKNMNSNGDGDQADAMLRRAESDAALAAALADEARGKARIESPTQGGEDRTRAKQPPPEGR